MNQRALVSSKESGFASRAIGSGPTVSATSRQQSWYTKVRPAYVLPGARVAVTHLGELVARATANELGFAYVPFELVEDTWHLQISVTGQDVYLYEAPLAVGAGCASALILPDYERVDDFNGRLDPGETSDFYVVVKNAGNGAAGPTARRGARAARRATRAHVPANDDSRRGGPGGPSLPP